MGDRKVLSLSPPLHSFHEIPLESPELIHHALAIWTWNIHMGRGNNVGLVFLIGFSFLSTIEIHSA